MAETADADILVLTAEIVASYVGGGAHLKAEEIPDVIRSVRAALRAAATPVSTDAAIEAGVPKATKAEIRKSISEDHLISFVDHKPYKTLKRHLARHGMSMGDYRERYGLPNDYPSVAPSYSAARSAMAKSAGLGARRKTSSEAPAGKASPKPRRKASA
jgi:predicted transcriptional regulator